MEHETKRTRRADRRSPFGCTGEMAAYLASISLTRSQERSIAAAIDLAKRRAAARGERIDSNEAMLEIARFTLGHPPGSG